MAKMFRQRKWARLVACFLPSKLISVRSLALTAAVCACTLATIFAPQATQTASAAPGESTFSYVDSSHIKAGPPCTSNCIYTLGDTTTGSGGTQYNFYNNSKGDHNYKTCVGKDNVDGCTAIGVSPKDPSTGFIGTDVVLQLNNSKAFTTAAADAFLKGGNGGTVPVSNDPSTTSKPDTGCGTDSNGNAQNCADDTVDCGNGGFNWLICPAIQIGLKAANAVDGFIMQTLDVDIKPIFDTTTNTGKGYYTAWNSFRIIGTALIVIGGLVMVASTALGFEFLDAYTIRKTLPRLLVAIIGISLSWPLMKLVVNFFDVVGFDIRTIMYTPFSHLPGNINVATGILAGYGGLGLLFTPAGWTFIITALLAVFVGFLIVVVRQVAIIMLIILAPVAIACYILPNTQKVWKLWYDNFLGLLLMFPIISGLIAAGHIFAAVSISSHSGNQPGDVVYQALALIAYFVPYFLLPLAARLATGIIGNLAGVINDRHKGAFDRLKGIRAKSREQVHARRMAEDTWLGKGRTGALYRRGTALGTSGSGALAGGSRYAAYKQDMADKRTAEALKNDNGRAAGNDDATALAVQAGMTRRKFINAYSSLPGKTPQDAELALAQVERGFGATIGSDAMAMAAFKARAGSSTAYDPGIKDGDSAEVIDEKVQAATMQRINEGGALVARGLMTSADATAAGKGNRARVDISGRGFGGQIASFDAAATSIRNGGAGMTSVNNDPNQAALSAQHYLDATLNEADPGDMLAGNTRTIQVMAPAMIRKLNRAVESGDQQAIDRSLGQIAGIQDNLNRTSPQKAAMFADTVNSKIYAGRDGAQITVRQMVEGAASNETFLQVRKEYGTARGREAAARGEVGPQADPEH